MSVLIKEATKMEITKMTRLHSSVNGVPRWEVELTNILFKDTYVMVTKSGASFSYDLGYFSKGKTVDILYHITAAGNYILDMVYYPQPILDEDCTVEGYVNTATLNAVARIEIHGNEDLKATMLQNEYNNTEIVITAIAMHFNLTYMAVFGWLRTRRVGVRDLCHARRMVTVERRRLTKKLYNPLTCLTAY